MDRMKKHWYKIDKASFSYFIGKGESYKEGK